MATLVIAGLADMRERMSEIQDAARAQFLELIEALMRQAIEDGQTFTSEVDDAPMWYA